MAKKLDQANIEIKAVCRDFELVRVRLSRLGAKNQGELVQRDIYYNHPDYRRKMRVITDGDTELINYKRSDEPAVRFSTYKVKKVFAPIICHAYNKYRYGIKVVVDKKRELWQWESVRIHLDYVTGLGKFLELEAVVSLAGSAHEAKKQCDAVVEALQLKKEDYLSKSYSDLVLSRKKPKED